MDLAPDNGKTDFIYSALEIIDRIFSVLDVLFSVQLQATGEGNIAPAKRSKRAQFLLPLWLGLSLNILQFSGGFFMFEL